MHVHVVSLASYTGFDKHQLTHLEKLIEEHKGEIIRAWKEHFRL